jgi:O-acetyl-ADP-ribose deacetylase (regulator of RNase III)
MIEIVEADITTLEVDAIVNAANSALCGGGGVDGAIHLAAGPELLEACRELGGCPTGQAVLTRGFALPARSVIHAVGPVWSGGEHQESQLLAQAYRSSFEVALKKGDIRSIAFPALSTGAYKFPRGLAASIAVQVMRAYESKFQRIIACLFDPRTTALYWDLLHGDDEVSG